MNLRRVGVVVGGGGGGGGGADHMVLLFGGWGGTPPVRLVYTSTDSFKFCTPRGA